MRDPMTQTAACRAGWPLERRLFAIAGTVALIGAALSAFVSTWFLLLIVFAGLNQWLFALAGFCPMSLFLTRVLHVPEGGPR